MHRILVDALGEPVVAAWTPLAGDQRWYVIPDATDWNNLLGWLLHRALPEYVPAALRRARTPHFIDPDLQSAPTRGAGLPWTRWRPGTPRRGCAWRRTCGAPSRSRADRYGLLYGSGAELVAAVANAFASAGLTTLDLDEAIGDTKSADLLVSAGEQRRLIEVKAVSGAAQESLVGHLQRHLDTWPQLCPHEPVSGGVLVVNHQHKLHPTERSTSVYARPEFVNALTVPVLSTVELFNWWRTSNWQAIRSSVLGPQSPESGAGAATPTSPTLTTSADPTPARRRWWPRTCGR